jgi:2-iminobutanoate/2-iminopropanoate deaminase
MMTLQQLLTVMTILIADAKVTRTVVSTPNAPPAIGPYSQGIIAAFSTGEGMVYVAGQIGMRVDGNLVSGGIKNETKQLMTNIGAILRAAGSSFDDVVECHVMLADMDEYADFNQEYATWFAKDAPVRAAYQVSALPKSARAEVKCSGVWNHDAPSHTCTADQPCGMMGCVTSCPDGPDGPEKCIDGITGKSCYGA